MMSVGKVKGTPLWENSQFQKYFIGGLVYVCVLRKMEFALSRSSQFIQNLEELSVRKEGGMISKLGKEIAEAFGVTMWGIRRVTRSIYEEVEDNDEDQNDNEEDNDSEYKLTREFMHKKKHKRNDENVLEQIIELNESDSMKEEYESLPVEQRKRRNIDE
ncbi:MAG: hypothetical protein EZS28_026090 [Streblomastix strix]|uniref:Uncharacterized protein n=1 Tax=Streblomastix strix TaxID=222440 RepID=A0A5J4V7H2_9EUKA|nr:MAG: hypothetical protein EZS28_026090 [Streblomastix strix]